MKEKDNNDKLVSTGCRKVTFTILPDENDFGERDVYFEQLSDSRWHAIYRSIPDAHGAPVLTTCHGIGATVAAATADLLTAWHTGKSDGNSKFFSV
jgi:hypothetical protein